MEEEGANIIAAAFMLALKKDRNKQEEGALRAFKRMVISIVAAFLLL